jgi:hypothetical protein
MLSAFIGYDFGKKDAELRQEIIERHIENGNDDNVIKFIEMMMKKVFLQKVH